ncbi:MAG: Hpt domain-containing protein, partial [Thermodesulfobacteriota bacterium]
MDSSLFGYSMDDFKEEAKELLSKAEDIISEIKDNPENAEGVNALFRAIHSLKGSAAYVGLADVTGFSHLYESFLGDLRSKKYKVTDNVLNVLIRSRDYLDDLIFHSDST